MSGVLPWLAVLYVALLPVGRSGLLLNAQWGDLLFPALALAVWRATPGGSWWRRSDWPLLAYLAVTALASVVSPDPAVGLSHLAKQVYVAAIFLVFRRLSTLAGSELAVRILGAFVAAMALVCGVSILVVFLGDFGAGWAPMLGELQLLPVVGVVRRLRGLFEAPEFLGNALLLAFLLALGFRGRAAAAEKPWWAALAGLLAVGEFLTYSRSVAGFCVATALFVAPEVRSRGLRASAWIMALAVVLVVNIASVIGPMPKGTATHYEVGSISMDVLGVKIEGKLMSYAALKQIAWSGLVDHPITGVGPGRFTTLTETAFREGRITARYRSVPPHSDLAGRLAEAGVFGGLSLVILWIAWLRALRPALSGETLLPRAAAAAVIGILVNSLNADVMNFRFLWIALAWATMADVRGRDEKSFTRP